MGFAARESYNLPGMAGPGACWLHNRGCGKKGGEPDAEA